ncbi:MAG: hypothetical protein VKP62_06880 [Candidatus Sericytochromatia bacterium]|nr:hypothetical protein [Candidatus Sericytochromatia bacterium]
MAHDTPVQVPASPEGETDEPMQCPACHDREAIAGLVICDACEQRFQASPEGRFHCHEVEFAGAVLTIASWQATSWEAGTEAPAAEARKARRWPWQRPRSEAPVEEAPLPPPEWRARVHPDAEGPPPITEATPPLEAPALEAVVAASALPTPASGQGDEPPIDNGALGGDTLRCPDGETARHELLPLAQEDQTQAVEAAAPAAESHEAAPAPAVAPVKAAAPAAESHEAAPAAPPASLEAAAPAAESLEATPAPAVAPTSWETEPVGPNVASPASPETNVSPAAAAPPAPLMPPAPVSAQEASSALAGFFESLAGPSTGSTPPPPATDGPRPADLGDFLASLKSTTPKPEPTPSPQAPPQALTDFLNSLTPQALDHTTMARIPPVSEASPPTTSSRTPSTPAGSEATPSGDGVDPLKLSAFFSQFQAPSARAPLSPRREPAQDDLANFFSDISVPSVSPTSPASSERPLTPTQDVLSSFFQATAPQADKPSPPQQASRPASASSAIAPPEPKKQSVPPPPAPPGPGTTSERRSLLDIVQEGYTQRAASGVARPPGPVASSLPPSAPTDGTGVQEDEDGTNVLDGLSFNPDSSASWLSHFGQEPPAKT